MSDLISSWMLIALVVVFALVIVPIIAAAFLRNVDAGTIRLVSWLHGGTVIYRGPGKSKEIPLLTIGTTISSKVINVDLDITDQTADVDAGGTPCPIKVRVLASAIVSVGDTDTLIKTAANRFFSKSDADQISTLTDLLSSSGRRAINLLTHNQLFSAKAAPVAALLGEAAASAKPRAIAILPAHVADAKAHDPRGDALAKAHLSDAEADALEDEDDPLAVIIRKACSRELTDLGLIFNSLNIKVVMSEVAEARRRQSAAEAQANAEIVAANQSRRAKEAQLDAERAISDKQRELEQTKASNAALIAQAEAKRQEAAGVQRGAELDATLIAQAKADAMRVRLEAEAAADAEAIRIRRIAEATAESIEKVNLAIQKGGESYFRYRQIELLPQIAPTIAHALARAKLITIAGGDSGAAQVATGNITSVIQTVLAAQLVSRSGLMDGAEPAAATPATASTPSPAPAAPAPVNGRVRS
jgi:flotillin